MATKNPKNEKKQISDKKLESRTRDLLLGDALGEFIAYLRSPWRIFWTNFLAGVCRGLGILVGMTVVIAFLVWILTKLVDFPLIGQYFLEIKNLLESFAPDANYR